MTGKVQERLEQPPPSLEQTTKDGLFHLVNGLLLIGGVLKVFDQAPEGFESLVDVHRASLLLGRRRKIKLDRDGIGGKHDCGSSSLGYVSGPDNILEHTS